MVKLNKNKFKQSFETKMYSLYAQSIKDATDEQLLNVLCSVIKDIISKKWVDNKLDSQKEVYYFSIEFLLGRQLKSNLLNLGIEDVVRTGLKELNIDLDNLINGYLVSDIKVENNKITIKYDVDLEKNYYKIKSIYLNNNKLMISTINHDSNGVSSGQNVILNNVKEFNVYIKEALIYFEIITDSGESRIRCI